MNRVIPPVLIALLAGCCARAQEPGKSGGVLQKRIQKRIEEMRRAITKGEAIVTHVRVRVRLRNGHKLQGVVKNGRFVEKVDGLDFVVADTKTPGAGLRIWYYDNTNSYIFLPFESISSYRIGQRLTDLEIKKIEDKIEVERQRAEAQRRDYLARKAERDAAKEQPDQTADPEAAARASEEEKLLKLLEEFPPDDGWGPRKREQLELRKITLGVYPNEKEKRFLSVFEDWQKALKVREKRQAEKESQQAAKQTGTTTGSKGEGAQGGGESVGQEAKPLPKPGNVPQPAVPPNGSSH